MLKELTIRNFAIIEDLDILFQPGLVVLTGETGAGKSIILDALGSVLGSRVDTDVVRKGADRASVEAVFSLTDDAPEDLIDLLENEGLMDEPDELTMSREIRLEGRSIARVNGRSVSLSLQAEIGAYLVDLHGQSEHLSLLKVRQHLALLDRFAGAEDLLAVYQEDYRYFKELENEQKALLELQRNAHDRLDMLRYQIQELEAAKLKIGEEEGLRQERNRLANAESLHSLTQQSLSALDEGSPESPAVTDLLGQAVHCLMELTRVDPSMTELANQADQALSAIADLAYQLRGYQEGIEYNPQRLDQIEERLNTLSLMKRKYGGTVEAAIEHLETNRYEISKVSNIEEQIEQVNNKITEIKQLMAGKAQKLSQNRKIAAVKLSKGVETNLNALAMKNARFSVTQIHHEVPGGLLVDGRILQFDATGIDKVEFLVETNPGEGFKPLAKTASGGETSRLMLAIKHVLTQADQIPTLVFDEIDQGIGGRVGAIVGELLWHLGREHQVLCVTHLPQLAAYADHHLVVSKTQADGRTSTQVTPVSGSTLKSELAAMIGSTSEASMQSAQELIELASAFKSKIV